MERNSKTEVPFHVIGNIAGRKQYLFHVRTVNQHLKGEMICQNIPESSIPKQQSEKQKKVPTCYGWKQSIPIRFQTLVSHEIHRCGAVSTRSMKKVFEIEKVELKPVKDEPRAVKIILEDDVDMSHLLNDGMEVSLVERANRLELSQNPLFKANLMFLQYKRQGLKGAVKKEQFAVHV